MRIVIAEDSAVLRAGLCEILKDSGHEVAAAVGDGFASLRNFAPPARAREAFADTEAWQAIMLAGMAKDFSWNVSAAEYARLYERLAARI